MELVYRAITGALAFTGCMSLALTGEISLLFFIPSTFAMIIGYYRYIAGKSQASRWIIGGLAIVELFVLALDMFLITGDYLVAIAHMTLVFQALKSFDFKEPWDPLQVYFMALLQLIITSELSLSIIVGAVYVVFLAVFMAAMVFSHFMKEGTLHKVRFSRPLWIIMTAAFMATVVFFVALPRLKSGVWGKKAAHSIKTAGMSDTVDFGTFGKVLEDSTIVMRVELSGPKEPLYWRGSTLDYFDGVSWSDTIKNRTSIYRSGRRFIINPSAAGNLIEQKIIMEPLDTDVVFGLGLITEIEAREWRLGMDGSGTVFMPVKLGRRFSYTVYSRTEQGRPVYMIDKYLQLPGGMQRITGLAKQTASGAKDDLDAASKIDLHLKTGYRYSLETSPPPQGMSPIEDFLFNSKRGFCEHYAASMVLMLRSVGIPSRIVMGFAGGEESERGDFVIIRQNHAHSWVEAAIGGRWVRFDPTPARFTKSKPFYTRAIDALKMRWYQYVIGFSSYEQFAILRSFTVPVFKTPDVGGFKFSVRPVYIILLAAAVVITVMLATAGELRFRRLPYESRMYLKFRNRVKRMGGNINATSTSADTVAESRRLGIGGAASEELVRMYEDARFGAKRLSANDRMRMKNLARENRIS